MAVLLILVALGLLIAGAWAGLSVLVLAPLLAGLAALAAGAPVLAAYTQVFMAAAGGFVVSLAEPELGRELALRLPYVLGAMSMVVMLAYGAVRLRL